MGVPAFFRWLSRKYGSIVVDAVEEKKRDVDGVKIPIDTTKPNPNFQEFDVLYLDMNGIIHPCTHPEDRPAPKDEDEMFVLIFEYIDRLFSIVRPRRILYMAIDGVAPRAKMNQQRSRRFRAAKEAIDKQKQIMKVRKKLEEEGYPLPELKKEEEHFDSNCITPGTPFMDRLAIALRYYIHKKVSTDPAWQSIQIILSDANVPGEGEHKIMNFIRRQRSLKDHDPNTVHCLCGADADLIMLGLATHEANFNILREEFVPNQPKACELCGQYGHELDNCQGLSRDQAGPDQADPLQKEKNFIFIRLPVLREFLEIELSMPDLPFPYDFERAIDDWVFMCFFVGNDFLPHLPSLEIRENAIDRLIKLYKEVVYQTKGWLTNSGEVYMDRVQYILVELGKAEDEIFKTRHIKEQRYRQNNKNRQQRSAGGGFFHPRRNYVAPLSSANSLNPRPYSKNYNSVTTNRFSLLTNDTKALQQGDLQKEAFNLVQNSQQSNLQIENTTKSKKYISNFGLKGGPAFVPLNANLIAPLSSKPEYISGAETRKRAAEDRLEMQRCAEASERLRAILLPAGSKRLASQANIEVQDEPQLKLFKEPALKNNSNENKDSEDEADEIKLWEAGWKDRYYQAKFNVSESDIEFRRKVAWAYTEGLCWVLRYYYQGCASWNWYFPYHYAPFASDFDTISQYTPDFSKPTKPFYPLEQLMGVFPAASKAHIPEGWKFLMTDKNSPIYDFYPNNFEIDLNGKKYAWQGVALLPFVDEKRLLDALKDVYSTLTIEEICRNCIGQDRIFMGEEHPSFKILLSVYKTGKKCNFEEEKDENEEIVHNWISLDPKLTNGMSGEISWDKNSVEPGETYLSIFSNNNDWDDVQPNKCLMSLYRDPQFPADYVFEAIRLSGVKEIEKAIKPSQWNDRKDGQYQPQIGFTRNIPRANLSSVGHRILNRSLQEPSSNNQEPYQNYHQQYQQHNYGQSHSKSFNFNQQNYQQQNYYLQHHQQQNNFSQQHQQQNKYLQHYQQNGPPKNYQNHSYNNYHHNNNSNNFHQNNNSDRKNKDRGWHRRSN